MGKTWVIFLADLIDEYAAEIGLFIVGIFALIGLILLWPL